MASHAMSVIVIFAIGAAVAQRPSNEEFKAANAADKKAAGAAAADQSKMAAVDKVVSMLEDLQLQVLAEGEAEAVTYNKFACFCKTTQKDKSGAIKTGKTDKNSLTAEIKKLSKHRDDLDTKIAGLNKEIKK